ncbi:MAG: ComEC/Rec2 family competence protein, partial [Clostridia bacterium]|nr:ComEC/Rec2 family competence protein [Clostridia bacterium]
MPSCTTRRKIRIFNFRLMPFLLFGIVSGIFAVTRANAIISILILMCVAAIFAALLFVTDIKKGIVLLFAVAVLGGGMAASATHYKYIDSIGQNAENTSIVARVCGINYSFEEDTYSENIKKIYVDSIVADGVKYKGGAFLYNNSSELSLSIGDQIIINGDIQQLIFTTSDTYSLMLYNDKIYYKIEAETVQKSLTFAPTRAERIRSAIFVKLEQSLGARVAGFAYSMLFGDKAYLYPDDKSDYQLTGTAHVFAVSGLHIGVLAGVIILILKKLKSKNLTILIIVSACLLIYAWLSSFSPSVLRAG